tara:strand:+ start:169 stop:1524 length:1356 start_codon:yes stop_codon:yes gene_type:complete
MAATKKDVEDFQIVISEAVRLSKLLNESYDLYANDFDSKYDSMFATINVPKDIYERDQSQKYFQLHLSSMAQKKLQEITSRQIKQNNWVYELTSNEYINHIKDSIYIHIKEKKEFDLSGCSSLLSRAYKRARSKMREVSYFFPIHAEGVTPEKDIQIGNVRITHKENIYPKIKDEEWLESFIKTDEQSYYNSLLCIDIPKCSNEISRRRAQNVADFIYGVIKVFAASSQVNTNQMVLKKNPSESNTSHYIECSNDEYYVCGSISFRVNLKEFWCALEEDLNSELGEVIKKLTECAISPRNKNCLSDRLIDAFCWFGDASRDNNEHSQVVKLVTAMERLVTLSIEKKDAELTKRFCSRVSCSIAIFHGEIDTWKLEAKRIYELRSDLVHGSQNLYKSYELPLNVHPFRLASFTILSSCIGFNALGLDLTNYETQLKDMYHQLAEHCLNEKYN